MKVRLFFVALGFLLLAERFGFIATALVIAATVTMLLSRSRATPIPDDSVMIIGKDDLNAKVIDVSVIDCR